LGILPGGGGALSSFVSYAIEKRVSKHPEKFGTGAIEGVAGPESANNAGAMGSFIPLLTLGIPFNAVTAILLAGFMIHGIIPNPLLIKNRPDMFWGLVASMYVGNILLLILNLPLIRIWIKLLSIPYVFLFPVVSLLCLIGAYTLNNNVYDLYLMIIFGIIGYVFRKFKFEGAPLILALILGKMFEDTLRQSLIMSAGDFRIFIEKPIAAFFVLASAFVIIIAFIKKRKWEGYREEKN
jgi:putative tricarboxylic transport membrane protein